MTNKSPFCPQIIVLFFFLLLTPNLFANCSSSCNTIANPGFNNGLNNWQSWSNTPQITNGEVHIVITNPGANPWNSGFAQNGAPLEQGKQYQLSFDARTTVNRPITAKLGLNGTPYTTYSFQTDNLTTTMTTITQVFTMNDPTDMNARLEFHLGAFSGDVFIDNVCLQETNCSSQTTQNVELKVFLEGCYHSSQDKLAADLKTLKLLPGQLNNLSAQNPYGVSPWNYSGTEVNGFGESLYNNVSTNHGNGDVIDWVLVAFREGISPNSTIGKKAGLLMEDGYIIFPEEVDFLTAGTAYYVKIDHFSHIGIMSSAPVMYANNMLSYDFTTQDSYLNGAGFGSKEIEPGVWTMFAGNCDQQNQMAGYDINGIDRFKWGDSNGMNNVYVSEDMNLDGFVNEDDRILWESNNGIFSTLLSSFGQSSADQDNDGIQDVDDNCPAIANPIQEDADSDGSGDVCDNTPFGIDNDGDSFFPFGENPDPNDNDECIPDNSRPNCDQDGDGVINSADDCPNEVGDPTNNGCPMNAFPTDILVRARGFVGSEDIELEINGVVVHTWNELPTTLQIYTHTVSSTIVLNQLRVNLIDGTDLNGQDQNVQIDYVEIDGVQYQSEASTTLSLGSYTSATGCAQGFKNSDQLHCTGWFEYDVPNITIGGPPQPNEAPVITTFGGQSSTVTHSENSIYSIDLDETDPNAGDDHVWNIIGGSDQVEFTINSITGVLSMAAKDYEMPIDSDQNNIYRVIVEVSDNGNPVLSDQISLNISITDQEPESAGHVRGSTYIAPTSSTYLPVYDTAWQMFARATPAQAGNYFAALRDYGFTGTWASVLHHAPARLNDNFTGGGQIGSVINGEVVLSQAYIARVNAILDEAENHGMKVGLLVNWQNLYLPDGGADSGNPQSNLVRGIIDESNACAYGLHMIEAFGSHPALSMWVLGGDAGGNNYDRQKGIWEIMANCMLPLTDLEFNHHLPTAYSVSNPNGDGHLNYTDAYWLDMVAPETGHTQTAAQTQNQLTTAVNAYNIPVWQGEARYFGIDYPWVGAFRNPGVQEMMDDAQAAENAGVAGYVYGNGGRWGWCTSVTTQACNVNNIGATFGAAEIAVINIFTP